MSDAPCTCTPEPPAVWEKGVCVKCWHWAHTPSFRRQWEQKVRGTAPAVVPKSALPIKCRHLGDVLPPRDAVELGLGSVRRYSLCAVGMAKNTKKLPGYASACSGCGPRCEKYSLGEDR